MSKLNNNLESELSCLRELHKELVEALKERISLNEIIQKISIPNSSLDIAIKDELIFLQSILAKIDYFKD